jgi:hypothetical protein
MNSCSVGEKVLNDFLSSDEQLSPAKKAQLDAYLNKLTEHVSATNRSVVEQSLMAAQSGMGMLHVK